MKKVIAFFIVIVGIIPFLILSGYAKATGLTKAFSAKEFNPTEGFK